MTVIYNYYIAIFANIIIYKLPSVLRHFRSWIAHIFHHTSHMYITLSCVVVCRHYCHFIHIFQHLNKVSYPLSNTVLVHDNKPILKGACNYTVNFHTNICIGCAWCENSNQKMPRNSLKRQMPCGHTFTTRQILRIIKCPINTSVAAIYNAFHLLTSQAYEQFCLQTIYNRVS